MQPEVDEDDEEEYKEVSYVKPQFDNEKVYQLIEETVDKVFLPTMPEVEEGQEAEPQPYVSLRTYSQLNCLHYNCRYISGL